MGKLWLLSQKCNHGLRPHPTRLQEKVSPCLPPRHALENQPSLSIPNQKPPPPADQLVDQHYPKARKLETASLGRKCSARTKAVRSCHSHGWCPSQSARWTHRWWAFCLASAPLGFGCEGNPCTETGALLEGLLHLPSKLSKLSAWWVCWHVQGWHGCASLQAWALSEVLAICAPCLPPVFSIYRPLHHHVELVLQAPCQRWRYRAFGLVLSEVEFVKLVTFVSTAPSRCSERSPSRGCRTFA